jgi:hypothetical protein
VFQVVGTRINADFFIVSMSYLGFALDCRVYFGMGSEGERQ